MQHVTYCLGNEMKVSQDKKVYSPVTIVLESEQDYDALLTILCYTSGDLDHVVNEFNNQLRIKLREVVK